MSDHYTALSALIGGAAENSPYVISPDTNAGNKRWILSDFQAPFSHVEAKTATGLTLTANTNSALIFATEVSDLLSEYNVSTGAFVPIYSGEYLICVAARSATTSWNSGSSSYVEYQVDAGTYTRSQAIYAQASVTFGMSPAIARKVTLVAGESFIPYFWHNRSGGNTTLFTNDNHNWITIDRIA